MYEVGRVYSKISKTRKQPCFLFTRKIQDVKVDVMPLLFICFDGYGNRSSWQKLDACFLRHAHQLQALEVHLERTVDPAELFYVC